jgi:acetyltransferase
MTGIVIRPLTRADRELMTDLPSRISPAAASLRFHVAMETLPDPMLDVLMDLEAGRHEALIALDDGAIVGIARFARDGAAAEAEVAVVVADDWQHRGIARRLMEALTARALAAGITRFRADMLGDNAGAHQFFSRLAPVLSSRTAGGHVILVLDLAGPEIMRTP